MEQGERMGNEVRLVDLEVIKRYSLAVRQEAAPAEDVLAALDASREVVLAVLGGVEAPAEPAAPARKVRAPRAKKATGA